MPKLSKLETYIPVSLFLMVASFNFLFSALTINDDTYLKIFFTTNEIVNAPLFVGVCLLYVSYRHKLCYYNKVSSIGLIMMNVINLLAIHTSLNDSEYYTVITQVTIVPVVILALILLIKKI